jgi:hypothetical protein
MEKTTGKTIATPTSIPGNLAVSPKWKQTKLENTARTVMMSGL